MSREGYLGDNDEIYLPNSIKEALNFYPHQEILIKVIEENLLIYSSFPPRMLLNIFGMDRKRLTCR